MDRSNHLAVACNIDVDRTIYIEPILRRYRRAIDAAEINGAVVLDAGTYLGYQFPLRVSVLVVARRESLKYQNTRLQDSAEILQKYRIICAVHLRHSFGISSEVPQQIHKIRGIPPIH